MNLNSAEKRRREILAAICSLGDMRRGSLAERHLPCGRPGCHCNQPTSPGHGPKYSLTTKVGGTTKTKYVGAEDVEQVQAQLDNRKRFEQLCGELLEVSETICRLRLQEGTTGQSKKNSSKRSKKKSLTRSSGC